MAAKWALGVSSRHLMGRIYSEKFWGGCPLFADECVRCQALERLESSPEVVGFNEGTGRHAVLSHGWKTGINTDTII